MNESLHPQATQHLPMFITAPGDTDVLMVVVGIFLLVSVVLFGVFFFWLHSLPERLAHRSHKVQMEVVAVLCLISLFTHMHIFWIAGLILAFIDIPDFGTPLRRIAGSMEKLAGVEPDEADEVPPAAHADGKQAAEAAATARDARRGVKQADGAAASPAKPALAATRKERRHV